MDSMRTPSNSDVGTVATASIVEAPSSGRPPGTSSTPLYNTRNPALQDDPIGPSTAAASRRNLAPQSSESPPLHPQPPPPSSPPSQQPEGIPSQDVNDPALQQDLHMSTAQVTAVHTTAELMVAFFRRRRDIEIRSHLDLRSLPLTPHELWRPIGVGSGGQLPVDRDIAFLRSPTRSIRVCHRLHNVRFCTCMYRV